MPERTHSVSSCEADRIVEVCECGSRPLNSVSRTVAKVVLMIDAERAGGTQEELLPYILTRTYKQM